MAGNFEAVRAGAISDAFALLAVLADYPTAGLVEGLLTGAVQRDAASIAREAGMDGVWSNVLDMPVCAEEPLDAGDGASAAAGEGVDAAAAAACLLKAMRVEYTCLFDHPEKPQVPPYEGQFLYEKRLREESARSRLEGQGSGAAGSGLRPGKTFGGARVVPGADSLFDERPRMFVNPAALDAERCYRAAGLARSAEKNVPGDHIVTELQFMSYLYARLARALHDGERAAAQEVQARIDEFEAIHVRKWAAEFFAQVAQASRVGAYRFAGELGARFFAAYGLGEQP